MDLVESKFLLCARHPIKKTGMKKTDFKLLEKNLVFFLPSVTSRLLPRPILLQLACIPKLLVITKSYQLDSSFVNVLGSLQQSKLLLHHSSPTNINESSGTICSPVCLYLSPYSFDEYDREKRQTGKRVRDKEKQKERRRTGKRGRGRRRTRKGEEQKGRRRTRERRQTRERGFRIDMCKVR